jgi:uncharacterized protein (TIGR02246 family)
LATLEGSVRVQVIVSASVLVAVAALAQNAGPAASDEHAVRDVVTRYVDARERRDAAAIAAVLTEDADQYTTSGEWRRGRDAVVSGGLASSSRNPGTRAITVESVRFLGPDVVIADGGYEIRRAGESATRRMWTTIVLRRGTGGWRIAAIRNAAPTQ